MKVAIVGDRNITDYGMVDKAIKQSGFEITEVVSGGARGVDTLAKEWAQNNGVKYTEFKANWDDLTAKGAIIKVNKWNKKYNANAGFDRNQEIASYSDAAIAIQSFGPTPGTQDCIKRFRRLKKKVHCYEKDDTEYEYFF